MGQHIRVGILDDEPHVRETTALLLEMYCPSAEIVFSEDPGYFSIEQLQAVPLEIVLLDLGYTGPLSMTPYDVIHKTAANVIIITAHERDYVEATYPGVPYLLKPISGQSLKEMIESLL